jgi:hypothetical protein
MKLPDYPVGTRLRIRARAGTVTHGLIVGYTSDSVLLEDMVETHIQTGRTRYHQTWTWKPQAGDSWELDK